MYLLQCSQCLKNVKGDFYIEIRLFSLHQKAICGSSHSLFTPGNVYHILGVKQVMLTVYQQGGFSISYIKNKHLKDCTCINM